MFLRSQLLTVYESLSNKEKNSWGVKAGYTGYRPLYNYLKRSEGTAKRKVLEGLKAALDDKYESTIEEVLGIKLETNENTEENQIQLNIEKKLDSINLNIKDISSDLYLCRNLNLLLECQSNLEKFLKMINNNIENLHILADFESDNQNKII